MDEELKRTIENLLRVCTQVEQAQAHDRKGDQRMRRATAALRLAANKVRRLMGTPDDRGGAGKPDSD